MATGGLKYNFARLNIAEKLIAINVLVFILDGLARALYNYSLSEWFQLPKDYLEEECLKQLTSKKMTLLKQKKQPLL